MYNDSIETLLLHHYGDNAPIPPGLEQRLISSVQRQANALHEQQSIATYLRTRRVSRRQAVRLVAIGSAGLGLLSVGIEGLQTLEKSLLGGETTRPAYS